jgi:type II secretory pathway component PulL
MSGLSGRALEGYQLYFPADQFSQTERIHEIDYPVQKRIQHAAIVADDGDADGSLLVSVLIGHFRNSDVESAAAFFHQAFHYPPLIF